MTYSSHRKNPLYREAPKRSFVAGIKPFLHACFVASVVNLKDRVAYSLEKFWERPLRAEAKDWFEDRCWSVGGRVGAAVVAVGVSALLWGGKVVWDKTWDENGLELSKVLTCPKILTTHEESAPPGYAGLHYEVGGDAARGDAVTKYVWGLQGRYVEQRAAANPPVVAPSRPTGPASSFPEQQIAPQPKLR